MPWGASALIGREDECAALDTALDGARRRRGGTCFLVGEAGIGKSRLSAELVGRAFDGGLRVLRGRSSMLGPTVPFRPIAEALLGLFRTDGPLEHPDLVPYRPALGRLIPEWRPATSPDRPESLVVLAEAVLRVLTLAGAGGGCVVVLEDLHEADAETLTVVEYLVDNLDRLPVLLLCTVRAEAGAALELARAAARRRSARVLDLAPLSGDDVHRLAASCLDVPAEEVPPQVVDRLRTDCGGNPFMVEELLDDLTASGALARFGDRWRVFGDLTARVPTNVVASILQRADRLGPQGHEVLSAAAVIGRRFPLAVLQEVTGLDDRTLLSHLHAGLAARLVAPDDQASDWYMFRHALTAEALLAGMGPAKRADLARRGAEVVEARYPDLPGDWCQLAAGLRLAAGDRAGAGRCYAEAGRRAMAGSAATSAAVLLDRARELLADDPDTTAYADVLELLLRALIEAGRVEQALAFSDSLARADMAPLSPRRRTVLHTQLAAAATMAGRWSDGAAQLAAARALVADDPDSSDHDATTAPIDVVAAQLALAEPRPDSVDAAERLASRAADAAARADLPVTVLESWHLLGLLARRRGMDESDAYFRRMTTLAEQQRLPMWRVRAYALLASNDLLRDAALDRVVQARDEAMRIGAVAWGHSLEASLALYHVLRGEYAEAEELLDRCLPAADRLGLVEVARYATVARATLAAHRGRHRDMDHALDDFRRRGGEQSDHQPIALGLCRAVCALLDEDVDAAHAALAREAEHGHHNPSVYTMTGRYGLSVLLGAMRGDLDLAACEVALEEPPSHLRWNRQFALLGHAVLLGRTGRHAEAEKAFAAAQDAAEPFRMARHLGARLVAEAAIADGWGDPTGWLRDAEEYFHSADVPAAALACRSLLRRAGATVGHRRQGYEAVPEALRRVGVTTREYEVLVLLLDRLGNKEIAGRLYISPRTVEKHVASLLVKTGQDARPALVAYITTTLGAPH